eukprot:2629856-Ditylum_brightwellii.AAC.1
MNFFAIISLIILPLLAKGQIGCTSHCCCGKFFGSCPQCTSNCRCDGGSCPMLSCKSNCQCGTVSCSIPACTNNCQCGGKPTVVYGH